MTNNYRNGLQTSTDISTATYLSTSHHLAYFHNEHHHIIGTACTQYRHPHIQEGLT